jgi:TetR/AcrR family transcriptional regulator, regulator of cefoperazone and chloramphenicol sensitivity
MAASDSRTEETRNRLVMAGLELFGRQGFDAVTTRELAEAAGVNQAAIPYHFGGKEGVYRAVAEHVAAVAAARIGPQIETVRRALAAGADPAQIEALLLETTVAVARALFEPHHLGVWPIFLTREQFQPSSAFEHLYAEFAEPVHVVVAELIGRLAGVSPEAQSTVLLAHAYLGQILVFAAAHATLNRRLGLQGDFRIDEPEAVLAAIRTFSGIVIRGLRAGLVCG